MKFSDLVGKTLVSIVGGVGDDHLNLEDSEGNAYAMFHRQDCCENVAIQDISGDVADLLNTPILAAEETSNRDTTPENYKPEWLSESSTWTFYRLTTIKGTVVIRWLGESNGYYSESVDFEAL